MFFVNKQPGRGPKNLEAPVRRWRAQKKRKEKKWTRQQKKQKKKGEAQKKLLVDKAQRTSLELLCVGKERRGCKGEWQKEEQESEGETSWESLEDGSSFSWF